MSTFGEKLFSKKTLFIDKF